MVRKSRTLYEMLERRRTQPRGDGRPQRDGDGAGPVEALRTSLGSVWSRLRGQPPAAPAPTRWLISSPTLAAVVFVCLGIGFATGHWLVRPAAAGGAELRTAQQRGPEPPGRLAAPAPRPGIDLPAEQEERELSQWFFPLLTYSPSERVKASRLALYLREHGIPTARVRAVKQKDSDDKNWLTLAYLLGDKDDLARREDLVRRLKAVTAPPFASDWTARVQELATGDLSRFK
jgi:hypothetical protein